MILINPRSTKFGIFEKYVPLSVPIGVGSLAAVLESKGVPFTIVDEHIRSVEEAEAAGVFRSAPAPRVFGISTLTGCVHRTREIARFLKERYPDSRIVLGGIHPTVLPEESLADPAIDLVLRGEADLSILTLAQVLGNNGDLSGVPGLSYRKEGRVVHVPEGGVPDLKALPPFPYHLFEEGRSRYNFGFIATSRGCPYECIFCSQRSITGQRCRYLPTDTAVDLLELLVRKYGQTHVVFLDDNFTTHKQRVTELCEMMIRRGLDKAATYDFQTRADAADDATFALLKRAGFRIVNYGFESASERLMVILNKKETVAQNVAAVKLARKHGFGVSGTFIFGIPTETREERWAAYRMAVDLDLDYVRFNNATPYPGTKLYEMAKAEGRLRVAPDWSNLNACGSLVDDEASGAHLPYVPLGTEEKTLRKDVIRANLYFSLRPRRVLKLLVMRVGPAGWFFLPARWYVKPAEWWALLRLAARLVKLLIKSL